MRRQQEFVAARLRRQSVTLGRVAAWLSFGGAVLAQASLLTCGYLLTDDASPNAVSDASLAGCLFLAGLAVMAFARHAGQWAQASMVPLGRAPLRLVSDAESSDVGQYTRTAA